MIYELKIGSEKFWGVGFWVQGTEFDHQKSIETTKRQSRKGR